MGIIGSLNFRLVKSLRTLIKGSLTLIGLFFVLSCVVAVLLFPFDKINENNVFSLILVLTVPVLVLLLVLLSFSCLIKKGYDKLITYSKEELDKILEDKINTCLKERLVNTLEDKLKIYFNEKLEKISNGRLKEISDALQDIKKEYPKKYITDKLEELYHSTLKAMSPNTLSSLAADELKKIFDKYNEQLE
jgi:ABC-type multidrug transport system fused ATPase/permease subunit